MGGLEATKAIRQGGFDTIPIVAITVHAIKGDRAVVFGVLEKWVFEREKHGFEGIDHKV